MLTFLAAAAAFIGVLLISIGFFQARGGKSRILARMDALESYSSSGGEGVGAVPLALRKRGSAWTESTRKDLDRAGLALKLHEYTIIRLAFAFFLAFVAFVVIGSGVFALFAALSLAVVGFLLPRFYVHFRANRELNKFNSQLEEMITLTANSLRAGFGLLQSLEFSSQQLSPPMSTELTRVVRDTSMGATLEQALVSLGERMFSHDLQIIITAILIQRESGSNLSEVLDHVAKTIRERDRMRGEVSTLTAQKKLSGYVVGALPFGLAVIFFVSDPEYMSLLWTTGLGQILLFVAIALDVMGILWIRRIVNIEM